MNHYHNGLIQLFGTDIERQESLRKMLICEGWLPLPDDVLDYCI